MSTGKSLNYFFFSINLVYNLDLLQDQRNFIDEIQCFMITFNHKLFRLYWILGQYLPYYMLSDQPVIHKKMSAQEKENKRKIKRSKGGATMRRRKEEEEQKLRQKKGNSEIKEPLNYFEHLTLCSN